jgi:DNA-binding XRE family transcriptional regulator
MRESKRKRLAARGWRVGSVKDFLGLTDQGAAYIELKLRLAASLLECRRRCQLTQMDLARFLRSSQSRIAKMERGDPSVSLDLLVRSLLALGTSARQLSRVISARSPAPAA